MSEAQKKRISSYIVLVLTVFAFYNSYMHGVSTVRAHTPTGAPFGSDYGLAAIPEVILLAAVLRGSDWRSVVAGSGSVLWTFWVNLEAAQHSPAGVIVALIPPYAALLCLWLSDHDLTQVMPVKRKRITAQRPVDQKADPLIHLIQGFDPQYRGTRTDQPEPKVIRQKVSTEGINGAKKISLKDQAIAWAKDQPILPTIKEIQIGAGVSEATAKRVRAAVTAETASQKVLQEV
jgi:hypothetical protein